MTASFDRPSRFAAPATTELLQQALTAKEWGRYIRLLADHHEKIKKVIQGLIDSPSLINTRLLVLETGVPIDFFTCLGEVTADSYQLLSKAECFSTTKPESLRDWLKPYLLTEALSLFMTYHFNLSRLKTQIQSEKVGDYISIMASVSLNAAVQKRYAELANNTEHEAPNPTTEMSRQGSPAEVAGASISREVVIHFSDLPQSSQGMISAAQLEAERILANGRDECDHLTREAYAMGVDFSPNSVPRELAREKLMQSRDAAAVYLFDETVTQCWQALKPDVEALAARLDQIAKWVSSKFGPRDSSVEDRRRAWSAEVLRERARQSIPKAEEADAKVDQRDKSVTFPHRADWFREALRNSKAGTTSLLHTNYGGPDRRIGQKILDGVKVGETVLEKTARALTEAGFKCSRRDIPDA